MRMRRSSEMIDLVHARDKFPHLSEVAIQGTFLTKILSPGEMINHQTWPLPLPIIDGGTFEDSILEVTAPLRSSCENIGVSFSIKDYEVEARVQGYEDSTIPDLHPIFRQGSSISV